MLSDLEPLRAVVGDARVVAIGEAGHRVHEFYQIRHRLTRFLMRELGFTALVMESGFPEGLAVDDWISSGPGDLDELLRTGFTYHMGRCSEVRDQLSWMREVNSTARRRIRFYGMDPSDSSASAMPAVERVVSYLDTVDPAYAANLRQRLMPLFDYLPSDRSGFAWTAPALHAYMALEPAVRHEMTARIGAMTERLQAQRLVYQAAGGAESYEVAYRCGELFLHQPGPDSAPGHTNLFLAPMPALDPDSLDELLTTCGMPRYLLDLRTVPGGRPVRRRQVHDDRSPGDPGQPTRGLRCRGLRGRGHALASPSRPTLRTGPPRRPTLIGNRTST